MNSNSVESLDTLAKGTRFRVLVVAYACNPDRGSESGVGWGWPSLIAERHDVVVLTAEFNRPAIETYLASHPNQASNLRFLYVPHRRFRYRPEGAWLRIEGSLLKPVMNLAYQCWLGDALKVARETVAAEPFDLVHLLTYVGYRFPGKFYTLGLPFVWGPIGGLQNTPWPLLPMMGMQGALFHAGRNIVNSLQLRLLAGPKAAFKAARGVIAATTGMREAILRHYGVGSEVICEVGPPDMPPGQPSIRQPGDSLVISWSGRHLPGKALHLLLRSLASLPQNVDWRLKILGDGPGRASWEALAVQLGIQDRCEWLGWLPRRDALEHVRRSHVFAITSLFDLTSTVSVEAIAAGVPIVCLDHCGYADLVGSGAGIRIPLSSARRMERAFASAVEDLWRDESRRRRLSVAALARALEYSWTRKTEEIDRVYHVAAGQPVTAIDQRTPALQAQAAVKRQGA